MVVYEGDPQRVASLLPGREYTPNSPLLHYTRKALRDDGSPFPAWQGMQYFVSMFSGQAQLRHVDNDRYGVRHWTSAAEVLAAR